MRRVDHPRFRAAVAEVEQSIDAAWRHFRADAGTTDDHTLAEVVLQDPAEFDWRVVDGALKQLRCPDCGEQLGAGPLDCHRCELANGYRFAARETDRTAVAAGNEHAIRVASAVARTRHRYTERARCGYELLLPDLLAGALPTTAQAQRFKALINKLGDDELEQVVHPDELLRMDFA
ncbi:hypothetical protein BWI15_23120 [Kribbella sp. ALI-6-A]|uniref:hypothetical protein n=1 Tax=Kribbella sp. ALI-6-A TaxID=1933817 RepID=UPI00097C6271|nr:hypothetical protein [Kribbella sp. ALI-6-A]ONI69471.1 hypothetical protein BWI15_23120 [Kribbella sp. ALI-6-A]